MLLTSHHPVFKYGTKETRERRARTIEEEDLTTEPTTQSTTEPTKNSTTERTTNSTTKPTREPQLSSPHLRAQQSVTPVGVSPLNFPACARGPGRPKLVRSGAPKLTKKSTVVSEASQKEKPTTNKRKAVEPEGEPAPAPKRRGRPPGSKNKTKSNIEELVKDGDVCNICGFELNHATKKDKQKVVCKNCGRVVHKPCLDKYNESCICSINS